MKLRFALDLLSFRTLSLLSKYGVLCTLKFDICFGIHGFLKDGSKTIITRNPYQSPLDNLFQRPEIKRGLVKKVATDLPMHVRSNSSVCSMLRGLADQLLEGNYNCELSLMDAILPSAFMSEFAVESITGF